MPNKGTYTQASQGGYGIFDPCSNLEHGSKLFALDFMLLAQLILDSNSPK